MKFDRLPPSQNLGKLKISDERFFVYIVKLIERIAKEGNPQALSVACATLGYKSEELKAATCRRRVTNITWAI